VEGPHTTRLTDKGHCSPCPSNGSEQSINTIPKPRGEHSNGKQGMYRNCCISAYCLAQPMNLVQTKKYTAGRPGGISTADRAATACPTPMPTEERIHPTLAGLATAGDETVPQRHSKNSGHRQTCSECVVRLKVADGNSHIDV